jgi:hypothetical protein
MQSSLPAITHLLQMEVGQEVPMLSDSTAPGGSPCDDVDIIYQKSPETCQPIRVVPLDHMRDNSKLCVSRRRIGRTNADLVDTLTSGRRSC